MTAYDLKFPVCHCHAIAMLAMLAMLQSILLHTECSTYDEWVVSHTVQSEEGAAPGRKKHRAGSILDS